MTDVLIAPDDVPALAASFETASPGRVLRWAGDAFGSSLALASSFEDPVLLHMAAAAVPGIEVLFLDTQFHFAETLWYMEELRAQLGLNITVMRPTVERSNLWQSDLAGCCGIRKVEPLNRGLAGKAAWVTGLRRVDAPTRATTPVVEWDARRAMVKINPLATWTDEDMAGYISDHQLLTHPLAERGFGSIGCWPCTRPVAPGEDRRAGRWAGSDKTECGLHV